MYLIEMLTVLNLIIAKIANNPSENPISKLTPLSIKHNKKVVKPIKL